MLHSLHMHFGATSKVVAAPLSSDSTTKVSRRKDCQTPGNDYGANGGPGFGILARRHDGTRATPSDPIVTIVRIVCTLCNYGQMP